MVMRLVIGSRNRCPWSLATWLAMRTFDLAFEDVLVPLDRPETEGLLQRFSPSGRVPVLIDGTTTIWDSLAILEHLAERQPVMWPERADERALARSIAAELHSGFRAIERFLPLDLVARFAPPGRLMRSVTAELKRIRRIWIDRLSQTSSSDGPFLFGRFTIVDALFAPIAARFVTYALPPLDPACAAYVTALTELPAMREWAAEAASEVAAFARIPASPFHRAAPEPFDAANDTAVPSNRRGTSADPDPADTRTADTALAAKTDKVAARDTSDRDVADRILDDQATATVRTPLSRRQLEAADQPGVAYLDDLLAAHSSSSTRTTAAAPATHLDDLVSPPLPGIAYLDDAERKIGSAAEALAGSNRPSTSEEPLPRGTRTANSPPRRSEPREPDSPTPQTAAPRDEAPRQAPVPERESEPPTVRLRRPGTAVVGGSGTSTNRFARAISGGRERTGDPSGRAPDQRLADERSGLADSAGPEPVELPRPDRAAAQADPPAPTRTIRPSAIKPIGLATNRRR